jgi:hypothetical protein
MYTLVHGEKISAEILAFLFAWRFNNVRWEWDWISRGLRGYFLILKTSTPAFPLFGYPYSFSLAFSLISPIGREEDT